MPNNHCNICGKPLVNPESVAVGIGPECRSRLLYERIKGQQNGDFFGRPVFDYWVEIHNNQAVLMIVDLSDQHGGRSVTNAAEEVLKDIKDRSGSLPKHIVYKDTIGSWDRLLINENQEFSGFAPIIVGRHGKTIADSEAAIFAVSGYGPAH